MHIGPHRYNTLKYGVISRRRGEGYVRDCVIRGVEDQQQSFGESTGLKPVLQRHTQSTADSLLCILYVLPKRRHFFEEGKCWVRESDSKHED